MNARRLLTLALSLPAAALLASCATLMSSDSESETTTPTSDSSESSTPVESTTEEPSTETTTAEEQDVFDLSVGDCIEDIETIFGGAEMVDSVTQVGVIDCAQPHNAEVYYAEDLPDGEFPGVEALTTQSEQICLDNFESFTGVPYLQSELEITYFHPTDQSWRYGDRATSCMIVSPEPVSGSAGAGAGGGEGEAPAEEAPAEEAPVEEAPAEGAGI